MFIFTSRLLDKTCEYIHMYSHIYTYIFTCVLSKSLLVVHSHYFKFLSFPLRLFDPSYKRDSIYGTDEHLQL